jgi:hypothetical protein
VKALSYARERKANTVEQKEQKVLLVGMPETSDQISLPYVGKELGMLQTLLSHSQLIVTKIIQEPTKESVFVVSW